MSAEKLEIVQGFVVDGHVFTTRADAQDYIRRPKVRAALMQVTNANQELSDWLLENNDFIEECFDTGTIRRVTKSERAKLAKAFEELTEVGKGNSKLAFLIENGGAIQETFRWPTVKRVSDEEKAVLIKTSLVGACGKEDLADWIIANKDSILEAFKAGIEKREVSPAATEGLAKYRAKKDAEKLAADTAAAEAKGMTLEAYRAEQAAAKTKKDAEKPAAAEE